MLIEPKITLIPWLIMIVAVDWCGFEFFCFKSQEELEISGLRLIHSVNTRQKDSTNAPCCKKNKTKTACAKTMTTE